MAAHVTPDNEDWELLTSGHGPTVGGTISWCIQGRMLTYTPASLPYSARLAGLPLAPPNDPRVADLRHLRHICLLRLHPAAQQTGLRLSQLGAILFRPKSRPLLCLAPQSSPGFRVCHLRHLHVNGHLCRISDRRDDFVAGINA